MNIYINIFELNNEKINKEQLKNIQNDNMVKTLILERKDFIILNDKKISYKNYKPCKVIFKDNNYMYVFIKEEDFL